MGVLGKIVRVFDDAKDRMLLRQRKKNAKKKFDDPKRVAIYSKIELTKEQKTEIDKLYLQNYGKKIPYVWHRHYTAYTGKFDAKYFPELLYAPLFEKFMTQENEYAKVFTDKNTLSIFARGVGVKMPKEVISSSRAVIKNDNFENVSLQQAEEILKDIGQVFIKPSEDSNSGKGCFVADFNNGIDQLSKKTAKQILLEIGENFTVQERVKCHESISQIYDGSVNTMRIISYWWRGELKFFPVIMRIGSGGAYLDNAHAGGMFIAVDDDGTLHKKAFTEFKMEFEEHPDSKLRFEGHKISHMDRVFESVKKMHVCIPQVGVVNWDFTIDEDGCPVLIEANMNNGRQCGSIWLMEMAHGCGAFKENTEEVLKWVAKLEKLPKSKRKNYKFGRM